MAKESISKESIKDTPEAIWNKIKDIDLELFALENQTVTKHAKPVMDLSKDGELFVMLSVQAALPQFEEKLSRVKMPSGKGLVIESRDKFLVVKTTGF